MSTADTNAEQPEIYIRVTTKHDAQAPAPEPSTSPAPQSVPSKPSKSEVARSQLKPLSAGERPWPVTVGAIAAALIALAMVSPYAAGSTPVGGAAVVGVVALAALLVGCAVGMWQTRYWAVLGFQAYLAVQIVVLVLVLVVANSVAAALLMLVLIAAAGTLFWFLVKAMARVQLTRLGPTGIGPMKEDSE